MCIYCESLIEARWWLTKRYTCTQYKGDAESSDIVDNLYETKSIFASMDADQDNSLNLDEFAEGLRQHLDLVCAVIVRYGLSLISKSFTGFRQLVIMGF